MVYFHTSGNVKVLRNIVLDYGAASELSPYEYMKTYIEKCPETIEDTKLSWIAETFLSYHRHGPFLKEIANHLSEELTSDEDRDYFTIIFHAVTFQLEPKDMQFLYKCLFNLSRPLLSTFTKFLSNNEVLTFISQVAQSSYDTSFITDKIIGPLFEWQPYISDMAHNYAEYVKKMESRKLKPPTVPVQPNVLNRKGKDIPIPPVQPSMPVTPPNSLRNKKKRMLTKTAIDQKLKQIHEKNKQRAAHLLNDVKTKDFHYAQAKSEKYHKRISSLRDEIEFECSKPLPKTNVKAFVKSSAPVVKETAATVKRLNKRMQLVEEEEVQWLQNVMKCCRNTTKIDEIAEQDRQEKERERLLDIEKKHLMGQITYEEAVIAKKKLQEENKKKYEEFLKEKESWNEEIERWRKLELEKNRKQVEKLSLIELSLIQAKNEVTAKKKETADKLKKESEMVLAKAMKVKQEELERRINMIREIKILALIAKQAKVPKIIDLTETSGLGLLCEMSLAELQERISAMKMGLKEELEKKRMVIKDENKAAKQDLEETKSSIKNFLSERALLRKHNKKSNLTIVDRSPSKEISDLKKILEEKRKIRIKLSS
ncbi:cilia- and flagella-associated protein 99-like [Trichoplusia ni]|uniref:Cilia- and flagella-associated protein 99-like n=1 Tax=Trichoplusia ni TaxID=7111 RepID=A0A7E5X1Q9_TRINI|nr:cilia- and flagella-associated protein 99-like [Trichoplusia ni]